MPATIYTWPWSTSYTTETDTVPRVKIAKFGDGYEQRTPDGINNMPRMVQYVFDFDRATLVQVENFLRYTQGYIPFYYTPPYSSQGLFVADTGWQVVENSFDYATLKATFREVFELF